MIRIIEDSVSAGAEGSVFVVVKILTTCIIWLCFEATAPLHNEAAANKSDEVLTAHQQPASRYIYGAG